MVLSNKDLKLEQICVGLVNLTHLRQKFNFYPKFESLLRKVPKAASVSYLKWK